MQVGQVISGKYRLLRLLGDGGMGSVYEAQHEVLGTKVAIKVLHEDLVKKPGLVDRFLREARVSAQIQNPHVVRVLDVDRTADGAAYIVMELLAGEELSAVLERDRRLPLPVAVDYAMQILDALSAAHALGVVHRDLKPENVFVTIENGRPVLRLIDFGIAKARPLNDGPNLTVSGTLMGTPEYMAPEQAHSADKADARSDIYAVGVILYEMLSGTRPVDGADPRVVSVKVQRGDVKPLIHVMPEVPRDLAGLVHRAMAAVPDLRFATATEMHAALELVANGQKPTTGVMRAQASSTIPGAPPSDMLVQSAPPPAMEPAPQTHRTGLAAPQYGGPADPAWAPQGTPQFGYGSGHPPPHQRPSGAPRGRGRRGSGLLWVAIAVPILVGGGLVVAFAVNSANGDAPASTATTSPTPPASTPSASKTTPLPSSPPPPPLLPSPQPLAPTRPSPDRPHPSSAPSTGPSLPPSASQPAPPPAFSVPPFTFPPGFPPIVNPFPSPGGSGVGPVITLPTAFPPFGAPPLATPASSAAPSK